MLLWVFTVIDRRVVQSFARMSVTKLAAPRVPLSVLTAIMTSSVIYLTNRFQVAVRLFSNRSQMTSKCGKNKKVAHEAQLLCDLLLNRRTVTWNLFVLYSKEFKKVLMMMSSIRLSSNRS